MLLFPNNMYAQSCREVLDLSFRKSVNIQSTVFMLIRLDQ